MPLTLFVTNIAQVTVSDADNGLIGDFLVTVANISKLTSTSVTNISSPTTVTNIDVATEIEATSSLDLFGSCKTYSFVIELLALLKIEF